MWWYTGITGWLQCSLRKSLQFFPDSIKYDVSDLLLIQSLNSQDIAGLTQNFRVTKGFFHDVGKIYNTLLYFKNAVNFSVKISAFFPMDRFFVF